MFRSALIAVLATGLTATAAAAGTALTVFHDPACGCCTAWVDYMRDAGFTVKTLATPHMDQVKAKLAVPDALASCHTAVVDETGQLIEGHVPVAPIRKMLADPKVRGLAAPGMPANSPGMGPMDGQLITLDFNGRPFSKD